MKKNKKEHEEEAELIRNPVNVFQCGCGDCDKLEAMAFPAFKKHLLDVHGLKEDQLTGKKQMTMHMDGSYWYSYNYTWTLNSGLVFHQYIKAARAKDDLMRF